MALMVLAGLLGVGTSIMVPLLVRRVVDGPIRHGDSAGLLWLGLLALAFGVVESALILIRRWTQSGVTLRIEAAIRSDLYRHLQRLPVSFHDQWQSGQLLSRATSDLGIIRRFLAFGIIFLVVNTATFVTVVILLLQLYWPLGVLVALSAIPLFLTSRRFSRTYITMSRRVQDQGGDLATLVEESAVGIRAIKSFGRHRFMADRFDQASGSLRNTAIDRARMLSRFSPTFDSVSGVTLGVVLVAGVYAVSAGHMTIGGLVAFVSLQLMLVWPIETMGWIIANGQEAMTGADRLYDVFDTVPTVVDRPDAREVSPADVEGHLRFEDVRFGYPGVDQQILRGVDLDIRPGETVALVGLTGCGKTTLVSLVGRLYDVSAGRITLDGTDIRDLTLDSLRQSVSMAFEEPTLFSMSVRENVTLGVPDATDDDVAEALRVAQAEFVFDLPWGLATRVGEQGLSLSGGQRQRLALARAVLGRPRVLVLDDPLSALDVHTEALVEDALRQVLTGTTALLVVHRPSTVALADRVALLADGRIVAVGTHSELLATVPEYRAVLASAADETESVR
ncbi:ATP-binding cassette subfamily B protein [Longispora fulva]|uniref:ATP-binding cassette subfamily B protein n=2 Tax=Longispora fulva TaxID=619741 RepID=A0A8J7KRU3_9ACTN|nr:ABC transporter ATP-binding protein [Longispora fulva]MBG6138882.1 ATP-binding cassette subfamily B protein [Longispora fulva]